MQFTFDDLPKPPEKPEPINLIAEDGSCLSYAYWPDGHREYCTSPGGHEGMHRVECGGPGAWWAADSYAVHA